MAAVFHVNGTAAAAVTAAGSCSDDTTALWYFTMRQCDVASHGSLAQWLDRRNCDQQGAVSAQSCRAFVCNPGQDVHTHTHVPLSLSTIRYRRISGDALRLDRQQTIGLTSHWPMYHLFADF